jgi:hypothetical protein
MARAVHHAGRGLKGSRRSPNFIAIGATSVKNVPNLIKTKRKYSCIERLPNHSAIVAL